MHLLAMEFWPTAVTANVRTRQASNNALSCCDTGPNIFAMDKRSQALLAIEMVYCFRYRKAMTTGDSHKVSNTGLDNNWVVFIGMCDDVDQMRLAAQGCFSTVDFAFTPTSVLRTQTATSKFQCVEYVTGYFVDGSVTVNGVEYTF